MKALYHVVCSLALFLAIGCKKNQQESVVTVREEHYKFALQRTNTTLVRTCEEDLLFWKSRNTDEISLLKQASLYAERFKLTGNTDDLLLSDSLYHVVNSTFGASTSVLQSLAANAITQHEFTKAKQYLLNALRIGEKLDASMLMLVDVLLELGDHEGAVYHLKKIKNKNAFAYLIRQAKIMDHEGKLDTAILLMEKAFERIKGNKTLAAWTKTNLADMYGHAGRIGESYEMYLDVLRENPEDDYSLKGIAWIALSHNHNYKQAKKIVDHLITKKNLPEYQLLLAEIANAQDDAHAQLAAYKKFAAMTNTAPYKQMYAKYRILSEIEVFKNHGKAVTMAEQEVKSRPSPVAYDLLAWAYFHNGNYLLAQKICKKHIEGKTFEPEALYHLGIIYASGHQSEKAKRMLNEALASAFELGPSTEQEIKKTLAQLN